MSDRAATLSTSEAPLVPGISPQVYSRADFRRVADMIHSEAGIVLSDGKAMLAYSRIAPLLRKSRATGFGEFLDLLEGDAALKTRVIASLTTNHTYFNREPHHFEHFTQHVRPKLVASAKDGKAVRLWSAGSSSGEEIWTLMMVLMGDDASESRDLLHRNIIALASDLADHAVSAAARARYPAGSVEAVPEKLRELWCQRQGDEIQIRETLHTLVRFRQLNLLGPWPFSGRFDIIFCRNVMIYFDEPPGGSCCANR